MRLNLKFFLIRRKIFIKFEHQIMKKFHFFQQQILGLHVAIRQQNQQQFPRITEFVQGG